jgi:hypothetical protein
VAMASSSGTALPQGAGEPHCGSLPAPLQVAEAPKVRSNKVQGIHELDDDQQYRLPSTQDNDIDLSILTRVLCSSEQVSLWERGRM